MLTRNTTNWTRDMAEHLLMTYATRRPYRTTPELPSGALYDSAGGYWLQDGLPIVTVDEFANGGPTTKKCDQETGEDQKGE